MRNSASRFPALVLHKSCRKRGVSHTDEINSFLHFHANEQRGRHILDRSARHFSAGNETFRSKRLCYAPATYTYTHTHTHIHVYKHCITRAYVFIIISFLLFIPVRLPRCRSTEPSDAGTPFVVAAHVKIRRKYFTFRSARAPRRQRRGATSRGIHFEIRTLVRPGSGE